MLGGVGGGISKRPQYEDDGSLHARMRHSHRALDDDVDDPLPFSPLTPGGVTGTGRSPIFWQLPFTPPIDSGRGHRDGTLANFLVGPNSYEFWAQVMLTRLCALSVWWIHLIAMIVMIVMIVVVAMIASFMIMVVIIIVMIVAVTVTVTITVTITVVTIIVVIIAIYRLAVLLLKSSSFRLSFPTFLPFQDTLAHFFEGSTNPSLLRAFVEPSPDTGLCR